MDRQTYHRFKGTLNTPISMGVRIVLILLACLLTAAPAHAAAPDADPPVTNGTVETIVRDGSTLYLGGDFSYVGRRTSLARLGADGRSTGTFPRVTDGSVEALLEDGGGGWYVGGSFATIGGTDVPRLAHVLADGSVDPAFRPAPDGPIRALALAGGALYAGGDFDAPRRNLMLLDPADGSLLPGAPDPDGAVEALAANGGEVLVGGRFTTIAGQSRHHVAALAGGTPTAFDPGADGTVRAIAVAGADIYLGGSFRAVGGVPRKRLAAVDAAGVPTSWKPSADRSVHALAVDAFHVYAAGTFDRLGGSVEQGFGKLDRLSGAVQPGQANLAGDAYALALAGGRLYVAGPQPTDLDEAIVAIDLGTGAIAWTSTYAGGAARALAVSGGDVYAGGSFDSAGGEPRRHLAAIDLDTGAPTAWAPDPDAPVSALALHDGTLYAGGAFAQIAGAPRGRLAGFDAGTGALTAFDGRADAAVNDLVAGPEGVFAAFGTTLAALDPATGDARAGWNPAPNASVTALALEDGALYAGGAFTTIGGAARARLAVLDATTGQATAFDAKLSNGKRATTVTALAASGGGTVFVGGEFESAGGESRFDLAELDGGTGAATPWSAGWFEPDDVNAIGVTRNRLWIGGRTDGHALLSERDRDTGGWIGSLPHTHGDVRDLDTSHGALHAAGGFTAIDGLPHRNLASWTPRPALLDSPRALGAVAEGETLTCTPGRWEGEPTGFSYAWLRDGDAVATGRQYVISAADAGAALRCRVTARNRGGSETATSAPAGSPDPPAASHPPRITGTAAYQQTVTCDPGTWTGSPALSYGWRRDGDPIAGAQASTYTLTDDDAGGELSCRMRAESSGGSATADAAAVAVPDAPVLLARPTITGAAEIGELLTCGTGTWRGAPTAYSYRWSTAGGTQIGTDATYTVRDADTGRTIYCAVTASNAGGVTTAVVSAWIAWPPPVNTARPYITGTGVAGSRLTCHQGTWTDAWWVQRIRWLRDGVEVDRGWSWTPRTADIGRAVRCEVTMSNGRTTTALSAPLRITAPLPAAPSMPAAPPTPAAPPAPAAAPAVPVLTELRFVRTAVIRSGWVNVAFMTCRGACRATVSIRKAKGRKKHIGRARVVGTGSVYVKLKRVRRRTRAVVAVRVGGRTTQRRVTLKPR
jgi:trimeric autotransporter adhesin